ncbi:protein unc-93 homolog A-like [Ptychodera flava]|uniref:protein unc-93 homolog A-like n=1 Tax=Ptychodera flava TaxID=63121 RepID=UPI003969DCB5
MAVLTSDEEKVNVLLLEGTVTKRTDSECDVDRNDEDRDISTEVSQRRRQTKRRTWKNVFVIGFAFMISFSAYGGLQALQSSINCNEGLGFASLITVYMSLILSGLFLPNAVIRLLGVKWTIVGCTACYIVYPLANFRPSWYTMIPASVVVGLAASPLWTSEGIYVSASAYILADVSDSENPGAMLGKVFGFTGFLFYMYGIFGNFISATVYRELLTPEERHHEEPGIVYTCGASNCRDTNGNSTSYCYPPPLSATAVVLVIFIALYVVAILMLLFFLDKLPEDKEQRIKDTPLLASTVQTMILWKDCRMWMLVPIMMSDGLRLGVFNGDFNESYVSCGIGVEYVGYVGLCTSITQTLASYPSGLLTKYIGRLSQLAFGVALDSVLIIVMLLWDPDDRVELYFLIAAGWGVAHILIIVQLKAFLGLFYPDNPSAAFANFHLWSAVGTCVSFAMSLMFCVSTKLYILIGFQLIALALYAVVECMFKKSEIGKPGSL